MDIPIGQILSASLVGGRVQIHYRLKEGWMGGAAKPRKQRTFKERLARLNEKIERQQKGLAKSMATKQKMIEQAKIMKQQLEEALGG